MRKHKFLIGDTVKIQSQRNPVFIHNGKIGTIMEIENTLDIWGNHKKIYYHIETDEKEYSRHVVVSEESMILLDNEKFEFGITEEDFLI